MRLLQGIDRPDQGTIIVDDRAVAFSGPAEAFACGIGMVHQEFMLVPELTLLENLILASEPVRLGGIIDRRRAGRQRSPSPDRQACRSIGICAPPAHRCMSARSSRSCGFSIAARTC